MSATFLAESNIPVSNDFANAYTYTNPSITAASPTEVFGTVTLFGFGLPAGGVPAEVTLTGNFTFAGTTLTGGDVTNFTLSIPSQSALVWNLTLPPTPFSVGSFPPFNLQADVEALFSGDDRIIGSRPYSLVGGDDQLFGYAGNDIIKGRGGDDTLSGGDGEDLLEGGNGNDSLLGGELNDQLYGGAGQDSLEGDAGDDFLAGGNGFDILRGEDGNDYLSGGAGIDILTGGTGNDTLSGRQDYDTLTGGSGADLFVFNTDTEFVAATMGVDRILDFEADDTIGLNKLTFTILAPFVDLSGGLFATINSPTNTGAATQTAFIVYNLSNGRLFYNANGAAAGLGADGGIFANLTGESGNVPILTEADFRLI
jgi:Ca2+-binding RTX toxin-like protein